MVEEKENVEGLSAGEDKAFVFSNVRQKDHANGAKVMLSASSGFPEDTKLHILCTHKNTTLPTLLFAKVIVDKIGSFSVLRFQF